nr:RNA-dependent RNA polymerase [Flumine narna-like virus 15]
MHSWVSETLAEELARVLRCNGQFSTSLEEMLKRSLTGHIFVDENGLKFPQREGQLMGSITSFPFLCLANAAMCRWAMEEAGGRPLRLTNQRTTCAGRLAPLRVNGDDCVFRGRERFLVPLWEEITAFGGLATSVGKTYYSRKFAVINSVLYDFKKKETSDDWDDDLPFSTRTFRWVERRYVNLGLLTGQKRSTSDKKGNAKEDFSNLGVLHRELFRTCPEDIWKNVSNQFLYQHGNLLKHIQIPWFVPEWAGGVGLHASKEDVSEHDLKCISIIKRNWHDQLRRPMPISQHADWKMHKLVQSRLSKLNLGDVERKFVAGSGDLEFFETESNYSQMYKFMTIETLFRCQKDELYMTLQGEHHFALSKILDRDPKLKKAYESDKITLGGIVCLYPSKFMSSSERVLRHNTRVWQIASDLLVRGVYPDLIPTSFEELEATVMKENLPVLIDAQITHTRTIDLF